MIEIMMTTKVLAISGSLRAGSYNTSLVHAARDLAPEGVSVEVFAGVGELPLFNPDLDAEPLPPAVADLRARLGETDALLLSTPEYAHATSGVFKNTLDWLVGAEGLAFRPVVLASASPSQTGGQRAQLTVMPTLTMLGVHVVDTFCVPFAVNRFEAGGLVHGPTAQRLVAALRKLREEHLAGVDEASTDRESSPQA